MTKREIYQREGKYSYSYIHVWLIRTYGKAERCSNPDCPGTSKNFQWALRKEKEYDKDINNFIPLCITCHRKYDWGEEVKKRFGRKGVANSMYGRAHSDLAKQKMRKKKPSLLGNQNARKYGQD